MKKNILLSVFLAFALFCGAQTPCWDGTVASSYNGGDGTPENPYQIATPEQLALLAQQTNDGTGGDVSYVLTNDINLADCNGGFNEWVSIGNTIVTETDTIFRYFSGHFDGNGKMVSNLYQHQGEYFKGLFGCTNRAEIKNTNLSLVNIDNESEYAGALVAYAGLTDISNCNVSESIIKSTTGIAGGVVGFAGITFGMNGQIEDVSNISSCHILDVNIDGYWFTGGIVGRVNAYGNLTNTKVMIRDYAQYSIVDCSNNVICYVHGEKRVGGIVGMICFGTIDGCENNCSLSGGGNTGGICGAAGYYAIINNCLNNETGVVSGESHNGGIVGSAVISEINSCRNKATGSGYTFGGICGKASDDFIKDCVNEASFGEGISFCGGIVAQAAYGVYSGCVNYGNISGDYIVGGLIGMLGYDYVGGCANYGNVTGGEYTGGLVGLSYGYIANSYNRGSVSAANIQHTSGNFGVGGIAGRASSRHIYNVYNTGAVFNSDDPQNVYADYGNIVGWGDGSNNVYLNCYWLDDDNMPANGYHNMPNLPGSSSFYQGATPTSWILNEAQYGTTDMIEALNAGSEVVASIGFFSNMPLISSWSEDIEGINDGYPVVSSYPKYPLLGSEWYYGILNDDGNESYQYLSCVGDTVINHKKVKIIVKTNTLYDKSIRQSREYIYEYNGCVYWWHDPQQDSTMLYNFAANVGDEWTINVGTNSITMHVDEVGLVEYNDQVFRSLTISDENDIFSGTIVCSVGHITSFFPERLLENKDSFEMAGIRCYWEKGEIIYQDGDVDCDEIYSQWHIDVNEIATDNRLDVYPNPSKDIIYVKSDQIDSEYLIINTTGQIVASGKIVSENQQVDISNLPNGVYLLKASFVDGSKAVTRIIKQ